MSRAAKLARLRMLSCALGARLFPPSKWAGLFPSAAYRRSAPRSWRGAYAPLAGWDASLCLGIFCSAKGQRDFDFTLAFVTSHEACRRMAAYAIQAAGSRTRPASREACRRAAVTSQPSRMSREQSRARWARCGVKGQCPLLPNGGLCYTSGREPHQTGEPWHLSCHGGNFTAKPHVSRAPCAPMARSPGCRGTTPATTPAGDLWGSGF